MTPGPTREQKVHSSGAWPGYVARQPGHVLAVTVATGLSALIAMRLRLPPDFHLGTAVALALLPVTVAAITRYRGAIVLFVLAIATSCAGVLLGFARSADHELDFGPMVNDAYHIAGIGICMVALLWARSIIGLRKVALSYGGGGLLSAFLVGLNPDNPWKFSLAVPVILILLSLRITSATKSRQIAVMLALAIGSALADSRSLAATLLIAGALLLTERRAGTSRARSALLVVAQTAIIGVGGFLAIQGAILEGVLGEQLQERTQGQIDRSGSVIAGGRPELGATMALLRANPWGFGTGTIPSFTDISIAKEGMAQLGYDPINNGYVDRYMFGSKFEVHSFAGDLWLLGGIVGAIFAAAILVYLVYGMTHSIATGVAAGAALFLAVRSTWDLFFSPFGATYFTLAVSIALVLPVAAKRSENWRTRPAGSRGWDRAQL